MTRKNIQGDSHESQTLPSKKISPWNFKEKWPQLGAKEALNEYPYRQAFENMNQAVHIN